MAERPLLPKHAEGGSTQQIEGISVEDLGEYYEKQNADLSQLVDNANKRSKLDRRAVRRCFRVLGLVFHKKWSRAMYQFVLSCVLVILRVLSNTSIFVFVPMLTGGLINNSQDEFTQGITFIFIAITATGTFAALALLSSSLLAVTSRERISRALHYRYTSRRMYYRLVTIDKRIDNTDQRIAQDSLQFSEVWTRVVFGSSSTQGVVGAVFTTLAMGGLVFSLLGIYGVASSLGAFFITAVITKLLMNPIPAVVFRQDRLEGDFRFAHVHLRANSESVAFLEGHTQQHLFLNRNLNKVLSNYKVLLRKMLPLDFWSSAAQVILALISTAIPAVMLFSDALPHQEGQTESEVFILAFSYTMGLLANVGPIIQLGDAVSDLMGYSNRLGELLETMDENDAQQDANILQLTGTAEYLGIGNFQHGDCVSFEHVTIMTPDNLAVVRDLTVRLNRGGSILIVGPSGIGKSSILRALGELWPVSDGLVTKPKTLGRDGIFFMPQTPYFVLGGSLEAQICYPEESVAGLSLAEMHALLKLMKLEHILEYEATPGGNDEDWTEILSGGERQRLAMVRLLYHRPAFAILDECTSAVDQEMEDIFYEELARRGTATLSVAHRMSVRRHHKHILALGPTPGVWKMSDVTDEGAFDVCDGRFRTFSVKQRGQTETELVDKPTSKDDALQEVAYAHGFESKEQLATEFYPLFEDAATANELLADPIQEHVHRWRVSDLVPGSLESHWSGDAISYGEAKKMLNEVMPLSSDGSGPETFALNRTLVQRIRRLWRLGFFDTNSRRWLWLTLFLAVLATAGNVATPLMYTYIQTSASKQVMPEFHTAVIMMLLFAVGMGLSQGLLSYCSGRVAISMRENLTRVLHWRYLSDRVFYILANLDSRIDNPDQRIAQDSQNFCLINSTLFFGRVEYRGLIVAILSTIVLTIIGYVKLTYIGVSVAFGMALVQTVMNILLMRPVVPLVFRQDRLEGDFRFRHIRFRKAVESVAFHDGSEAEHQRLNDGLHLLVANERMLAWRILPLNMFQNVASALGSFAGLMIPGIVYFTVGKLPDATSPEGDLADKFMDMYFVYNALSQAIGAVFALSDRFVHFSGHANRLGDFLSILDEMDTVERPSMAADPGAKVCSVQNVTVVNPITGVPLTRDLSFDLDHGGSLLIRGPSGVGKSSLLRTLAGLWPCGGQISRPTAVGRNGVFFLPQLPFLALGTLKDQVVYPSDGTTVLSPEELRAHLSQVDLDHLLDRAYSQPNSSDQGNQAQWEQLLSGGEKQRVGMARLFYHRPSLVFLDEATAAVDVNAEKKFYVACKRAGISFVSVSHNPSAEQYHDLVLDLFGDGTWVLAPSMPAE